jgi:hypothetical protein
MDLAVVANAGPVDRVDVGAFPELRQFRVGLDSFDQLL